MNRRLVAISALAAVALAGCATNPAQRTASDGTVTCDYRRGSAPAKPVDPPEWQKVQASGTAPMTINFSDFSVIVELDRQAAPCAVNSFESLARQGWFNGSECHRLSTSGIFILQCGDPTGTGKGGPGYVFDDEVTKDTSYPAGALAMANSGKNTNGSQFFLVYKDTPLPPNYTVFGHVDEAGVKALQQRAAQGHDASYPDGTGRPKTPIAIKSVVGG